MHAFRHRKSGVVVAIKELTLSESRLQTTAAGAFEPLTRFGCASDANKS
jgi:hypothetical protein